MTVAEEPGDFAASFARLRAAVADACAAQPEWPLGVLAGIDAAARFASADPAAARRLAASPDGRPESPRQLVDRFAALLQERVPRDRRLSAATDEALVGGVLAIFDCHLRGRMAARLPALAPEIAFLVLVPYLGFEEAERWVSDGTRTGG